MYSLEYLISLAKDGALRPIDFIIAAKYCPGYDKDKAMHLEEQYFDTHGQPISDLDRVGY